LEKNSKKELELDGNFFFRKEQPFFNDIIKGLKKNAGNEKKQKT